MNQASLRAFYVLTVLRPDPSSIQDLQSKPVDWEEAARIALRFKMPLIFYANVKANRLQPCFGERTLAIFKEKEQAAVLRGFFWMSRLRQIAAALHEAGVSFVPLKGISLAMDTYEDPALRELSDLDILIRRRDFARCRQALSAAGYTAAKGLLKDGVMIDKGREYVFGCPGGGETDVHYRFFQWHLERYVFKIDSEEFLNSAKGSRWKDLPMLRLRKEDEFYYLLLCIVNDGFAEFRYYADADSILKVHGAGLDWDRLLYQLSASPLRRDLLSILVFMSRRLRTPLLERLIGERDSVVPSRTGGRLRMENLLLSSPRSLSSKRLFYFLAAERLYDKMMLVVIYVLWNCFSRFGWFKSFFIARNNPLPEEMSEIFPPVSSPGSSEVATHADAVGV